MEEQGNLHQEADWIAMGLLLCLGPTFLAGLFISRREEGVSCLPTLGGNATNTMVSEDWDNPLSHLFPEVLPTLFGPFTWFLGS